MTDTGTPVLFLGGAGLPDRIWDEVRAGLPEGTESAVARYPRRGTASLADHADAALAQAPWPDVALVAHSVGGVVACEVLARAPERVRAVLGVAAVFPRPGRSFTGALPLPARLVLPAVLRLAGTRPPAKAIRRGLAGGLPDDVAGRIVDEFDPESVRLYRDRTSARELPTVRGYLLTTADGEVDAATQRRSAATLGATWTEELPTGHLPMLEDPHGVSRVVQRLLGVVDEPARPGQPSGSSAP